MVTSHVGLRPLRQTGKKNVCVRLLSILRACEFYAVQHVTNVFMMLYNVAAFTQQKYILLQFKKELSQLFNFISQQQLNALSQILNLERNIPYACRVCLGKLTR